MIENWKDVIGYEGYYQVSDQGQIRSIERVVLSNGKPFRNAASVVLKQSIRKDGYRQVSLWKNGKHQNGLVHQIVADAFLGPRPVGELVRHERGDKSDNRATSLLYGTHSQNCTDTVTHGRCHFAGSHRTGETNPNAKITQAIADRIRERVAAGERMKALVPIYGVSYSLIKRIVRKELW